MGYRVYRVKLVYWRIFDRERWEFDQEANRMAVWYYAVADAIDANREPVQS